ncbi:MAG: hypothetical protein CL823_01475 [Crocinitomicaceae bacterium]|nr:hypothetical protein [Crocinitomicaceae bacterium]|tara:strand:- start:279 stop:2693 length:2415 start_codon:yes stop_codon:yes gene_type:complete
MKHLLLLTSLFYSLALQAQVTGISVETFYVSDGTIIPDGYTTYHVYANTTNSTDFVSAVYGDAENPLGITMDGNIYNSTPGFLYGSEINPNFFAAFPELEYDSWMTIGMLSAFDNGVLGNIGLDAAMADFTATGSFYIDDPIGGSWYNTIPCDPAVSPTCTDDYPQFGGADNKVLLAQITTDGSFTGVFNLQVFNDGNQAQNEYVNGLGFSNDPNAIFGCTDPNASNYDPNATNDDYSCVLPCTLDLVIENITTPTCSGDNDGSLEITATGAQGSDDYYLGEDDEQPSNFGNFNNLLAGTYYVMVEDGAGCQDSQYIEIPEVEEVNVTASLTQAMTCNNTNDAIIEAIGAGGDGNLQYYFAGQSPSTMTPNNVFTDLVAGNYTVIAVDGNGCTGSSVATQVSNPPAINVYVTATSDASCADIADGQIVVSAVGGAAPTTIQFEVDGNMYASSPINIYAGTFNVVAVDVNGCTGSSEDLVIGPDAIEVNASASPVACTDEANGSVAWAPTGGADGFTVMIGDSTLTGSSYNGLPVGFYTVEVEDANGCSASEIVEVLNADPIVATTEVENPLCNGDSDGVVTVSATGGAGSFQYSDDDNTYGDSGEFDNLSAGEYVFYVQDENGCEVGLTAVVEEPAELVITGIVNSTDVLWGEGFIDASVTGGTPDYYFDWTGPNVNGMSDQDLTNLVSGVYTLEVTDGNGCTAVEQFNVIFDNVVELVNLLEVSVYPNPSNGVFQINWDGAQGGDVLYNIVDAVGRQIESGVWNETASSFNTVIDLSSYDNGVYRLNVVSSGVPSSVALVKAN